MSRPGFVLEVDERTPALLVNEGEGFRLERFPLGTRVIYPPDSLPGIRDIDTAIRRALLDPHEEEPLTALLRPGMRLTIVFDDISLPLPQMRTPDVRQRIIEQVLELAAAAGVDDVELLAANSLHRRMTPAELKRTVGDRVYRSFFPHHLRNHDAEDPEGLVELGTTRHGEVVEINRRAAESDLIVYVNITLTAMNGGSKSVAVGLGSYRSLQHHHNVHTLQHSRSFNDPRQSAMHHSYDRMAEVLGEHVRIFTVETTLNGESYPPHVQFMNKREWEWSLADQASYLALRKVNSASPASVRRQVWQRTYSPYGITGVHAGAPAAVHPHTLANVHRQQLTEVDGQSDIGVWGLPFICPYNVNSIMNPILVMSLGLGYFFNLYRNRPIVRRGGVGIFYHPMPDTFHPVHHASYIDFYETVLTRTTDPQLIEKKYEEKFATDPWYRHLYRTSYAYHGVHPLYMWYWGAHALDHLGDVIFVGADRGTAARLGFRAASTLADALEMARETVGSSPTITYHHSPPLALADVR
ncbi:MULTISPECIES: lactate racemase domain-containing protein [unclassified Streptomyces]|uniref:lactate racemase domain-containing protein n=1 Tax=unclassified Streptomyces TaxID=2593676 RepID=UPI002DD81E51|nr:lactate racemase domain-containing protein [Streptomyces sp. NBC_00243]WRZ17358.1 nickel-dependent lactate racemase [Streptomyces sp. NBC_00243]